MAVSIRYRPNHPSFGKMMMSRQTQDLADDAAAVGAAEAEALAARAGLPATYISSIWPRKGPPTMLGGNLRRTARVVADHPLAAAFEFGTGRRRKREQRGHSPAYRILARAGSSMGQRRKFPGESGQIRRAQR